MQSIAQSIRNIIMIGASVATRYSTRFLEQVCVCGTDAAVRARRTSHACEKRFETEGCTVGITLLRILVRIHRAGERLHYSHNIICSRVS